MNINGTKSNNNIQGINKEEEPSIQVETADGRYY